MKRGRGRRGGPGLRHRADPPSRLPRRAEGLGDPPRRLPAREPRRDRALAHPRPRRPRLARVRPLHARVRRTHGPDRRGGHAARGAHPLEDHATAPGRRAPPRPARPALRDGHQRLLRGLRDRRSRHLGDAHGEHHRPGRPGRPVHHGRPAPLPLLPGRRQAVPERERRRARPAPGPGAGASARACRSASCRARGAGLLGHRPRGCPAPRPRDLRPARGPALGVLIASGRIAVMAARRRSRRADRRRHGRAVSRRSPAALREPRLRGQHAGDGRRVGRRRGVHALVQQRAPRQRPEVPGLHRRVRGRARHRRPSSSAAAPTTPSSSSATRPRRSTCCRPRCPRARGCSRAPVEHHSNMLPWRRHDLRLLAVHRRRRTSCWTRASGRCAPRARIDLVAVTGASNVTGEVWPVAELAGLAHRHGARLFVDAAQLAPHRAIDMAARGHRLPGALGPQALRAVRGRRAGGRRSPAARGSRCCRAAGRSSS